MNIDDNPLFAFPGWFRSFDTITKQDIVVHDSDGNFIGHLRLSEPTRLRPESSVYRFELHGVTIQIAWYANPEQEYPVPWFCVVYDPALEALPEFIRFSEGVLR